ncbi:hypothetical protein [Spirulina sp. CS-785/01]|uniref:hypothetical protein n=1 Tax=Spirulina sp. CS-785/01 TaxID=3021716 RepID=UPI00232AFEE0|nr:hypothetical protein [Spirulina sp. CS-785/01]
MFLLLNTHFKGVKWEVFLQDLSEKNWVILFTDTDTNQLKGFSTLLMYNTPYHGETISIVYSGDTIIDPSAWSNSTLARSWILAVNQLKTEFALGKLYWLLISGGYRTYRFLPIFWKEFYPCYQFPTPVNIQNLINFLANEKFAQQYDKTAGVVRFQHPHQLRDPLKGIPPNRLSDPHIRFFAEKNPGHVQGDELVCLTEICPENLTKAGQRMWFAQPRSVSFSLPS